MAVCVLQRRAEVGILPLHCELSEPTPGHRKVAGQLLSVIDMFTEVGVTALEFCQLASFPYRSVSQPAVFAPFQVPLSAAHVAVGVLRQSCVHVCVSQSVFFYLSTFGSLSVSVEYVQALAVILAVALCAVVCLCPLIRPRLLYKGFAEATPHFLLCAYSQFSKFVTRAAMLPIIQGLFRPFACVRPTGRTGECTVGTVPV